MRHWLTPEEMARKREIRKKIMYVSIPLIGALIGAVLTFAINSL
jgi:glycerol uptake facilitator-like aquaporin